MRAVKSRTKARFARIGRIVPPRCDIAGRTAPAWLQGLLLRRYGRTPFGEPRYRLVWAPSRLERSGGEWADWGESVSLADRQAGKRPPVRRRQELRWVVKYPGEVCWLIERWVPAENYGSPELWYRPLTEGGTRLACGICACGDYPCFGDYEDIGARMHWYPSERHLTAAVDAVERQRERMPASALGRARRRTWVAEREQERRDRAFEAAASELFEDAAPAFGGAPMVGYGGSARPSLVSLAERIGIRQHPL